MPGGGARLNALGEACARDTVLRAATRRELERACETPRHARASSLLANVALLDGRYREARQLLLEAQRLSPTTGRVSERLAALAARDSSAESRGSE